MGHVNCNPDFLLSDSEGGLVDAVEAEFPEAKHWGCYYLTP